MKAMRGDWRGLHVEAMDCLQCNRAVLLRTRGVRDPHAPLACQWFLDFRPERPGASALVLDRESPERLIQDLTGLTIRPATVDPGQAIDLIEENLAHGDPTLIYGDGFLMPWLPYFGRHHIEHTLLIVGRLEDGRTYEVVDAYDNKTEWGDAVPLRTYCDVAGLRRILEGDSGGPARLETLARGGGTGAGFDWPAMLIGNAAGVIERIEAGAVLARVRDHYAERVEDPAVARELTLVCWLIHRRRALHAGWLASSPAEVAGLLPPGFAQRFGEEVAEPWAQARNYSYLLLRRVSQGRAPLTAVFDLMESIATNEASAARLLLDHPALSAAGAGSRAGATGTAVGARW